MFNFIDYFIECNEHQESPTNYWRWAAIATLAAQIRDAVYVKTAIGPVYGNQYIVLFGKSGVRKGPPCKFAINLLRKAKNTKIIAGRASLPQVLRELAEISSNSSGVVMRDGSALLYSEEMAAFIAEDPSSVPLLTNLYDFQSEFSNKLVGGSVEIKNVCLSWLTASNLTMMRLFFQTSAINGGLLGRTLIIPPTGERPRRSLTDFGGMKNLDETPLVDHLKRVKGFKGETVFTAGASDFFNDWYTNLPDELMHDEIGRGSRLQTHACKVALCLAVARESFDYRIIQDDVSRAIDFVVALGPAYKEITAGAGGASTAYQAGVIIRAILACPRYEINRQKLLQDCYGELDLEQVDEITNKLNQAGMIRETMVDGLPGYKLTKAGIEKLASQEAVAAK